MVFLHEGPHERGSFEKFLWGGILVVNSGVAYKISLIIFCSYEIQVVIKLDG